MDLIAFEQKRILMQATHYLDVVPQHITDVVAEQSAGGPHDYYSNGDYWWPNPDTPDGLPYVRRDGESNPQAFHAHRTILRQLRTRVSTLAAAYRVTGEENYASCAVVLLQAFFLDSATKMNPHLLYAQAIPGRCTGRGIGIIDTLHLVEVPLAIRALETSPLLTPVIRAGLRAWFTAYLAWMTTHPYGLDEMHTHNNHAVCWTLQAAVFARYTGDEDTLALCRQRYKDVLLPEQMAPDGSFPAELQRTKPYGYSIFQLDQMAALCHILSTPDNTLWTFELPDGRGIRQGLAFLYPYLADKSRWPYPPDVQSFQDWPVRQPALLLGGVALGRDDYLALWKKLDPDPRNPEVRRNLAMRQPVLWWEQGELSTFVGG